MTTIKGFVTKRGTFLFFITNHPIPLTSDSTTIYLKLAVKPYRDFFVYFCFLLASSGKVHRQTESRCLKSWPYLAQICFFWLNISDSIPASAAVSQPSAWTNTSSIMSGKQRYLGLDLLKLFPVKVAFVCLSVTFICKYNTKSCLILSQFSWQNTQWINRWHFTEIEYLFLVNKWKYSTFFNLY